MDKAEQGIKKIKERVVFTNDGIQNGQEFTDQMSKELLQKYIQNIKVQISNYDKANNPNDMEFELVGVDASIANALRRIMICEIPTLAIHKVFMYQNTSVIPDEVLCHRLGLVPIKIDARKYEYKNEKVNFNQTNSVKLQLRIKCSRKPQYKDVDISNIKPEEYLINSSVFSSDLKYVAYDLEGGIEIEQEEIKPVHENILIAKLRENQEIIAELICEKGIGQTHAKWSPVSTAYYRLMPVINLTKDIKGKMAELLKETCPVGVFDIKKGKAVVANARDCTVCRECIRLEPEFQESIELEKQKGHYIQSVGIYQPWEILIQALDILKDKCNYYLKDL